MVVGYATQKKANLTGAVDKITSETMEAMHVNTIGEALQGQVPNLEVNIADGRAGRGASFNVRGTTSLNGGSPLILIDGIPADETMFNDLSPHDVESISVLKDAASAAIYGARGTYGVIMVQTKKAKKGQLDINYSNNFSWGQELHILTPLSDPVEYMEIVENEFNHNIGQYNWFTSGEIEYAKAYKNDPSMPAYSFIQEGGKTKLVSGLPIKDFFHDLFRKWTPKQSHHFSVSGGSDKLKFLISGDYNHEEGSLKLKEDKVNRFTLHSNIAYEFNKYATLTYNVQFTSRKDDMANMYVTSWRSNVWRWFAMFNKPNWPDHLEYNGQPVVTEQGFLYDFIRDYSGDVTKRNEMNNTVALDLTFLGGDLKLHGDFSYLFSNSHRSRYGDVNGVGPVWVDQNTLNNAYGANSYFERTMSNRNRLAWNAYATYDKEIGHHHFTVMAGANYEDYKYIQQYSKRIDPLSLSQHSLNLGTGAISSTDSDSKYANQSAFARLNYNFHNRYLLEVNGCYNVSSRFDNCNRDATFASVSGAWRLSEEAFFDNLRETIDNIKLRVSYGELGNQNIGAFDYLEVLSDSQSSFNLEGQRVTLINQPAPKSSKYSWETAKTIDFGIDYAMLKNRLSATFDWYQRTTEDMLTKSHSLPSVYGASVPKENNATLRNRGWEFTIGWKDKFKLASKDFSYGVKFSMSDYQAEITKYANPTNYLGDYYEGMKIGEIWGLTTEGLFKTKEEALNAPYLETNGFRQFLDAGCIKFKDVNNDGKINKGNWTLDNHGDFKVIGNTTPRYQYGITLNASWNGFDLYAFFKGVGKRDFYPDSYCTNFWGPYSSKYFLLTDHIAKNRWTESNPDAYFPRPQGYIAANGGCDLNTAQTRYLQDASYLRLKNLVIGYTIPQKLTRRVGIEKLRVYASGQNLFCSTNLDSSLDPEGLGKDPDSYMAYTGVGAAYPIQRVIAFGLELKF